MNRFEYVIPKSVDQVVALLKGGAVLKAGGIDLLDQMKEGTIAPTRLINLNALAALRYVRTDATGLRLGPTATLAQIAADGAVRGRYAALAEAAASAANPQIRNLATVGGNLCQRPRCWYFRAAEFPCLKKGGPTCFAKEGENKYHAIFGGGPSYIVHPSTMATALCAFRANLHILGPGGKTREVPLDKFFTLPTIDAYERENVLAADELITEIALPAPPEGTRSAFLAAKERQVHDWPLGEVAVFLTMRGETCQAAQVVLGAVAPIPWRAAGAEAALAGKRVTADVAAAAGRAAVAGAKPLHGNGYKVALMQALVARAVHVAAARRS
ncbi:MAG TPA: FAD binding domain-containing protein [Polyangia bacterium]|nr:FAD binding domain-containing protein [Polyangia bacterium]